MAAPLFKSYLLVHTSIALLHIFGAVDPLTTVFIIVILIRVQVIYITTTLIYFFIVFGILLLGVYTTFIRLLVFRRLLLLCAKHRLLLDLTLPIFWFH